MTALIKIFLCNISSSQAAPLIYGLGTNFYTRTISEFCCFSVIPKRVFGTPRREEAQTQREILALDYRKEKTRNGAVKNQDL